jgi:cell division protein ZapA (FtsZ GTPase activity inhibitor)
MENNAKKKVMIKIGGAPFTLITDETDTFVTAVEKNVNEKMWELTKGAYRVSRTDAALLCAVDFCSDKLKAEKKVMNLEAQVSLYDVNIRRLREELIALKQKLGEPLCEAELAFAAELAKEAKTSGKAADTSIDMNQLGEMLRASGDEGGEDKIRTLEKYLEDRRQGDKAGQTREDKLRRIEALLRGGSENDE